MTVKLPFFIPLAIVGGVFFVTMTALGDSPPITKTAATQRTTPTLLMLAVINGEDKAEGLAPEEMETRWQADTLSNDPLHIRAEVVTRYKTENNEGRNCARVKVAIGQDLVPLKGKTYKDCTGVDAITACKPFFIWSELDMCDDSMPPTANYTKYKADSEKKDWRPTVKELKMGEQP